MYSRRLPFAAKLEAMRSVPWGSGVVCGFVSFIRSMFVFAKISVFFVVEC